MFLHESPNDLCGWEPYAAEVAKRGFHVLIVDLRAFGLSQRGPYGGVRGAVADVQGAVGELKDLGAKRVAVVGASYGGATAVATAPQVGSGVAGIVSMSGELDLASAQLNALAAVPKITVPLLIMGSRKDHWLDEEDARTIAPRRHLDPRAARRVRRLRPRLEPARLRPQTAGVPGSDRVSPARDRVGSACGTRRGAADAREHASRSQPRARPRSRNGGGGDGRRTLDRQGRQDRRRPGRRRRDARDARHGRRWTASS